MNVLDRTFKVLEWHKLVEHLSDQCETSAAKFRCLNLLPDANLEKARRLASETLEATSLIERHGSPNLSNFPALEDCFARLHAAANLDADQFLKLASLLALAKAVKTSLCRLDKESFPCLTAYATSLHFNLQLNQAIDQCINERGELKDTASSQLNLLRRELSQRHHQIKTTLQAMINSQSAKYLQEPIFTIRNGRYVLPVILSAQNKIKGIVHDTSSSGATVFVEPEKTIADGNSIRILEGKIEREIERILSDLSAIARACIDQLFESWDTLITLDSIFARARLGIRCAGIFPEIASRPGLELKEARHPLLVLQHGLEKVIPNSVRLGSLKTDSAEREKQTLVITGPNTGGKTVLLKTIGLFALMVKAGLTIPALPGSKIYHFQNVLADIGDEQSLEQSLSTFSAHLTNIVEIVNSADHGSLVLLDEVGAGTDPQEGSALAQATLEHLNRSGALTVVTTHVSALKALAFSQSGFENGSFEFDAIDIRPTYHFRLGRPGASHAAEIAKRLGLVEEIIIRTESLLAERRASPEEMIIELEKRLQEATDREKKASALAEKCKVLESGLLARQARLEESFSKSKTGFSEKMEEEFLSAQKAIKQIVAALQKEPTSAKAQLALQNLEKLRRELGWLEHTTPLKSADTAMQVGQRVRITTLGKEGLIEKLVRGKEGDNLPRYQVRVGQLKFIVPAQDLQVSSTATKQPTRQFIGSSSKQKKSAVTISGETNDKIRTELNLFLRSEENTIDLRGLRVDEALPKLERFLDQSILQEISPLMIIHGHGTGAMKQAVRELLSATDYQIKFRAGDRQEGGDGVTIVIAG
jgi:DNA mismatch repair protein MutS2